MSPRNAPAVVCVRGPSRSGKTAVVVELVPRLQVLGLKVAYLKRTHHPLDLPEKASGRVWVQVPAAMVIRTPDRVQVTTPAGGAEPGDLLAHLPPGIDIALLETHSPEPYPTLLASVLAPVQGERVIGRWTPGHESEVADELASAVLEAAFSPLLARRHCAHASRPFAHGGIACNEEAF